MNEPKDTARGLEADAQRMMRELGELTAKLKTLGDHSLDEASRAAADGLGKQLEELKAGVAKLDKAVRANPWVFVLGALGLGWLLGKIRRS
jgi:ElaB/YqjD/DUF883 family membrane-anchored ribosome-binding protein